MISPVTSAYGGINYIEMDKYPHATVTRVPVSAGVREELDSRLSLIFLGHTHHSSEVHETVIQNLVNGGENQLDPLRREAAAGRDALMAGDFSAFGASMIRNTEAQASLHSSLVSATARKVFEVARRHGALGWKVNGAGGDGGSVTILSNGNRRTQLEMLNEINSLGEGIREIGMRLNDTGVRIIYG